MSSVRLGRVKKELERLKKDPPYGVSCWPKEGRIDCLEAKLVGAKETAYEGGVFKLEIRLPDRYPFEPPQVKFITQIYHPNIDSAGRICLDVLKSPPQGSWKPSQNLSTILTSIQLLLSEPNPDDGLMADISQEYKQNRPAFLKKAKEWVDLYAKADQTSSKIDQETLKSLTSAAVNFSDPHVPTVPSEPKKSESSVLVLNLTSHDKKLNDESVSAEGSEELEGDKNDKKNIIRPSVGKMGLSRKRRGPGLPAEETPQPKKSNTNL
jgi:ubiquitin-conjugating enzyme E2 T